MTRTPIVRLRSILIANFILRGEGLLFDLYQKFVYRIGGQAIARTWIGPAVNSRPPRADMSRSFTRYEIEVYRKRVWWWGVLFFRTGAFYMSADNWTTRYFCGAKCSLKFAFHFFFRSGIPDNIIICWFLVKSIFNSFEEWRMHEKYNFAFPIVKII